MPNQVFNISRYHPLLSWLNDKPLGCRVPPATAQYLSGLKDDKQVRSLLEQAGFKVQNRPFYEAMPELSVQIDPPPDLPKKRSVSPLIIFSRPDQITIPSGSALFKFALPDNREISESEEQLEKFQAVLTCFSERVMQSHPFVCVMGNYFDNPPHKLYLKGFTFVYSSAPDLLYKEIQDVLQMELEVRKRMANSLRETSVADDTCIIVDRLDKARRSISAFSPTLLAQVRLYNWNTHLVDLREREDAPIR